MTQTPRTYSPGHIRGQREVHARSDGYGRHRHLYLHDTMRRLATRLKQSETAGQLSWLDYGCGKGGFIEQIRPLGLFTTISGYDPAIPAFQTRPAMPHDLVTCLDVLDKVEAPYVEAVLADVAGFTVGLAVFDHLTLPKPGSGLRQHPAFYWVQLVRRHMDVIETTAEFPGMLGFERAVIVAAPREHG